MFSVSVQGLRVPGLGFRVKGFRVQGFGFRDSVITSDYHDTRRCVLGKRKGADFGGKYCVPELRAMSMTT